MSEIIISPVLPAAFIHRWAEVEPMLDKAMPVNLRRYLPIDILAVMIQGAAQGWFVTERLSKSNGALIVPDDELIAVIVTKIDQYPRRRGISVFAMAGKRMAEWFGKADEILTEYGRKMGCDHFEAQGRKGWERVLDLEPRSTFLIKEITAAARTIPDERILDSDGGANA